MSPRIWRERTRRRGFGLAEAVVLLVIVAVLLLLLILYLPRQRENARLIGCRRNLGQIGLALGVYAQFTDGALPAIPTEPGGRPGPLAALLEFWGEPDFSGLRRDLAKEPHPGGGPPVEHRLAGLTCPSDPNVATVPFPAPVSYRANAGSRPSGENGPFAPGRSRTLTAIEAADGLSYTSAFAERLVGDGRDAAAPVNYRQVSDALTATGCPDEGEWRGDAGSSWALSGWVSTLYNHALPPGAPRSCVAVDGGSALMGASSGHVGGVQVLRLDGSVREFQRTVDPRIWRAFGNAFDAPDGVSDEGRPAASAGGPGRSTSPSGPSAHASDPP